MSDWYDKTRRIPTPTVVKTVKMGDKMVRMLGVM
jgi:hypothetical protein